MRRAIASTAPAKPYVMPDKRLWWVLRPITPPAALGGSPSSIGGSLAVRCASASIEISTPGPITPPRYSPRPGDDIEGDRRSEVSDGAGAAQVVVRGDGVRQSVRPQLARILELDRHPRLHSGPQDEAIAVQVTLAHPEVLGRELGHHRRNDRSVDGAGLETPERQERGHAHGELVGCRFRLRREAPVLDEIGPVEEAK